MARWENRGTSRKRLERPFFVVTGEKDGNFDDKSICVLNRKDDWEENSDQLKKVTAGHNILDFHKNKNASIDNHLKVFKGRAEDINENKEHMSELEGENSKEPTTKPHYNRKPIDYNSNGSCSYTSVFLLLPALFHIKNNTKLIIKNRNKKYSAMHP
ncbi:unnamed protein product [Trypanosoma congolense IL3000]|uniref:WGS project CAEQ00000000 data, annotated contig 1802 n=1 Tax=Trypanosoma congolense (strain IL3000) TaxID=1068625 RepID=F9W8Z0_TRYCI|nr:unnamed protein product [Trypanosoma congolense IL3000]